MLNGFRDANVAIICVVFIAILIVGVCLYFLLSNNIPLTYHDAYALSELLRRDFSEIQIVDCALEYEDYGTNLCLLMKENAEREIKSPNVIRLRGATEPITDYISPAHIKDLEELGIAANDILGFDISYGEVKVGASDAPFPVYWYQVKEADERDFNAVLISGIPRKIVVN